MVMLLMVLSGRLRPRWVGQAAPHRPRKLSARRVAPQRPSAPPIQPVEQTSVQLIPNWLSHLQLHQRRPVPKAPAFLVPHSDVEEIPSVAPIPITSNVVTIGRDAVRATLILDDASVEALHARLQRENNIFRLADVGSVAGTWVNYTPVSQDGTILENGDFIHIGRICFQFTQREPDHIRKPVVRPIPAESEKQP
jgi:hypothetical protein